jgi:casein kinase II subunit alpha
MVDKMTQERLTAKEAMAHHYFNPIRDEAVMSQYLAGVSNNNQS